MAAQFPKNPAVTLSRKETFDLLVFLQAIEIYLPVIKKAETIMRQAESPHAIALRMCYLEHLDILNVLNNIKKRAEDIQRRNLA